MKPQDSNTKIVETHTPEPPEVQVCGFCESWWYKGELPKHQEGCQNHYQDSP